MLLHDGRDWKQSRSDPGLEVQRYEGALCVLFSLKMASLTRSNAGDGERERCDPLVEKENEAMRRGSRPHSTPARANQLDGSTKRCKSEIHVCKRVYAFLRAERDSEPG